jgi:hypothetical protein
MARVIGFTEQQNLTPVYRADGSIAAGGTPQLILPRAAPRSSIIIQNTSTSDTITLEFGCARATATVSNGKVTAITVTNAGFGFTYAPSVHFLGGGNVLNGRDLGVGYPNQLAPSNYATAHCVLSNGSISSIVIDNPGSGYDCAPYVQLLNDPNDTYGSAVPSATVGYKLTAGSVFRESYNVVTTDTIAVYGGTTGDSWFCMYTT